MQVSINATSLDDAYLQFAELLISVGAVRNTEELVTAIVKSAVCVCSCAKTTPVDAFFYLLAELQQQVNVASTGPRIEIVEAQEPTGGRRHEPLQ